MAKAKGGWYGEKTRHSQAKKYGKATPKKVNLSRYAGTWKQTSVRNEPFFQRGCEEVTSTYTPISKSKIKVTNRCYDGKGKLKKKITGTARSVSEDNKSLKVSFFPPFEGDYEIKRLSPDYKRAVVSSGKTTWTLKKVK